MKVLFLLLCALSFTSQAEVLDLGGSDGGGGRGVVCYDSNQDIESVELLDFFEGRLLEGYNISSTKTEFMDIYEDAFSKVQNPVYKGMAEFGTKMFKSFKFLPKGVRLKPVDDSGEIFIPLNCKVEQVANFQGISRVFIVTDYWNKMSEISKAGLIAHEALWYTERITGAKKSSRVRRTIARYFSPEYKFSAFRIEPKLDDTYCVAGNLNHQINKMNTGTSFFLSKVDEDNYKLEFLILNGVALHQRHYTQLDLFEDSEVIFAFEGENTTDRMGEELSTMLMVTTKSDELDVESHQVEINIKSEAKGDLLKTTMDIRTINQEFPGYDEVKSNELSCYKIDESDIQDKWWLYR